MTNDSDKLFLSRETCTALGLIPQNFPTVREAIQPPSGTGPETACDTTSQQPPVPESALSPPCTCPRRQTPPPKPVDLPLAATEAHRVHLQNVFLDFYKSSTFNTCEHRHYHLWRVSL